MTNLHLIRHGEAEINVRRVVGGKRGDTGLTPRGVAQAERLRDRLARSLEIQAHVLVASTLPRARQTAEIVAPALGLPIIFDDTLQEIDPGEADGLPFDEVVARFGIPDVAAEPDRPVCPGGESYLGFMRRVGDALDRLSREHEDKTVVLVTHGGFIDGSFVHFLRLPAASFPGSRFASHHTALTHWQHRPRPGWRLVCFNDASHTRDLAHSEPRP